MPKPVPQRGNTWKPNGPVQFSSRLYQGVGGQGGMRRSGRRGPRIRDPNDVVPVFQVTSSLRLDAHTCFDGVQEAGRPHMSRRVKRHRI